MDKIKKMQRIGCAIHQLRTIFAPRFALIVRGGDLVLMNIARRCNQYEKKGRNKMLASNIFLVLMLLRTSVSQDKARGEKLKVEKRFKQGSMPTAS
jgi:hypothetical protein